MRADSRQLSLPPRSSAQQKKMAGSDLDGPAFDEEAFDHDQREGTGVDHLRAGGTQQTHASNVKEKQQHFRDALPQLISSARHAVVAVGMLWSQQQAQHMTELQGHIDQWQPVLYGCQQAGGGSSPAA